MVLGGQMRTRNFVLALLFFFVASTSFANWSKIPSTDFTMDDPPAPGSKADQADFKMLHRLQESRNETECHEAITQTYPTFDVFYGESADILSKEEVATVKPLLTRVFRFSNRVASYFKHKYNRVRPYDADETIVPCVTKPGGSLAYPSSHALLATVGACVLSKIFPRRAEELRAFGKHFGQLRVIAGVHHPSDVKAGQALGAQICERLLLESDFSRQLAAVIEEIRR